MTLPRFAHRAYAFLAGYFWLPCPMCGRKFGGHERPTGHLPVDGSYGLVTCPLCAKREA